MYIYIYVIISVCVRWELIPHFTGSPNPLPQIHPSHSRAPGSNSVFLATVKSGTTQQRLPNITMTKLMKFDPGPVGATSPWIRHVSKLVIKKYIGDIWK